VLTAALPCSSAPRPQGQLTRACVELAKAWRMDKFLRRLDVRVSRFAPHAPHPHILTRPFWRAALALRR
jgi:hypothetical protein